jgi:hypothetical protein
MRTALTRALRVLADCLAFSAFTPFTSGKCRNVATTRFSPRTWAKRCSRIHNAVHAVFESLEERALMSTYYVSTSGNDANRGTSPYAPWRSIAKVNSTHFNPGDSLLFQGGQTFYGSLTFYNDGGSANNRFTISSYGSGKPTINSGSNRALYILDGSGITINNLNVVGTPGNTATQDGIRIENYSSNTVESGFTVENSNISGFGLGGIVFGSDRSNEGLNNILLTGNDVYNNVMSGIQSYTVNSESNTNITISHNQVHNNYGDGKSAVTGSGIMLQGLNNATIEYNSAYDNGAIGGSGAVGIWCYYSNDVNCEYNESYNNLTKSGDDGDAFDFDADTSNSIMQYNLAYGNDGGGFQLNQWHNDNLETGDIIRYNISQDNGRLNNYSGIDVWGKVLNAQIYNNTVYNEPAQRGQTSDIRISNNETNNLYPSNIYVANNIFVSTGGTPLVDLYAAAARGASNLKFAGNVYYSYSGASNFIWGNTDYTSLAGWRSATGEETLNGRSTGAYVNPLLVSPGNAVATANAENIETITSYDLQKNTPILKAGIALNSLFNLASALTGENSSQTVPGVAQTVFGSTPLAVEAPPVTTTPAKPTTTTSSGSGTVASGVVGKTSLTGWDIGGPNHGSNSESGNTDIITAGGRGITGTSDSYRFAFTTLSGNGQIIAQIASSSDKNSAAEAGLMIQSANAANASNVSLLLSSNNTARLTDRSTTGGSTSTVKTIADSGDEWVKLVRRGNTFNGYISSNSTTWTLVSTATVDMGTSVYIGLAVSAGVMGSLDTVDFKGVSLSGTPSA